MIISCLNQKGGVGKTTIATNLAYSLSKKNFKVMLADSDPQRSSMNWASVRHANFEIDSLPFVVLGVDVSSIVNDLPRMVNEDSYHFIIIDGAPRMSELSKAAIVRSDLIIMPMQPSSLDLWATIEMREMVDEAKLFNPKLISAVLLNRVIKNTNMAKNVMKELTEDDSWTFFDTQIGQRQAFSNASSTGRTVFEIHGASAAQKEIESAVKEILAFSSK